MNGNDNSVVVGAFDLGYSVEEAFMMMRFRMGGLRYIRGAQNILEITPLARFAVQEHNNKQNAALEFGRVLRASEQIVCGVMYHFTLEAFDGGKKKLFKAKVWEKPWMNFKQLKEFKASVQGLENISGKYRICFDDRCECVTCNVTGNYIVACQMNPYYSSIMRRLTTKVVLSSQSESYTYLHGLRVPARHAAWLLMNGKIRTYIRWYGKKYEPCLVVPHGMPHCLLVPKHDWD